MGQIAEYDEEVAGLRPVTVPVVVAVTVTVAASEIAAIPSITREELQATIERLGTLSSTLLGPAYRIPDVDHRRVEIYGAALRAVAALLDNYAAGDGWPELTDEGFEL